jgi:hypothetical protein
MDPEEKMRNSRGKKVFLLARALVPVVQRKLLVWEIAVPCGHGDSTAPDGRQPWDHQIGVKEIANSNSTRAFGCLYS